MGTGVRPAPNRLVRAARGFLEGIIEAWANLRTEFAMAVASRRDGVSPPTDWLGLPLVEDGAKGVTFIDATVRSNAAKGAWVKL
ncbi:MAG: hypothetical protein J4F49_06420 [Rhodobacteraceae bacterium]|nr:hypothetical protein [Paracoccaceae bacterium]